MTLPKTKQKKTEESFENNVMKRKSISYAFLRLMTSIKEKELMGHNLRRTLMSYSGRDFWAELQIQSYGIFKAHIWTTRPESSMMALNNE